MVADSSAAIIGVMGEQVVRYVDDSGFEVYADDVDEAAIDRAEELGATSLGSPREGARRADVSLMLVGLTDQGEDGTVAGADGGTVAGFSLARPVAP